MTIENDKLEVEGVALLDREAERLHDVVRWKHERSMSRIESRNWSPYAIIATAGTTFGFGIVGGALTHLVVAVPDIVGGSCMGLFLFLCASGLAYALSE